MTLRRNLWGKVLASHREIAATALTVKQSKSFMTTIDEIMAIEPSSLTTLNWEGMQSHEKTLKPLAGIHDTMKQLKAANAAVAGAQESANLLVKARMQLLQWSENALCPNFSKYLEELHEWASGVFGRDGPDVFSLDCKAAADLCPGSIPQLPNNIDNVFLLCCPLTAEYRLLNTSNTDTSTSNTDTDTADADTLEYRHVRQSLNFREPSQHEISLQ